MFNVLHDVWIYVGKIRLLYDKSCLRIVLDKHFFRSSQEINEIPIGLNDDILSEIMCKKPHYSKLYHNRPIIWCGCMLQQSRKDVTILLKLERCACRNLDHAQQRLPGHFYSESKFKLYFYYNTLTAYCKANCLWLGFNSRLIMCGRYWRGATRYTISFGT